MGWSLFIDECKIKGGKKRHRQWKKIGENKVNRKKNSGKKIIFREEYRCKERHH